MNKSVNLHAVHSIRKNSWFLFSANWKNYMHRFCKWICSRISCCSFIAVARKTLTFVKSSKMSNSSIRRQTNHTRFAIGNRNRTSAYENKIADAHDHLSHEAEAINKKIDIDEWSAIVIYGEWQRKQANNAFFPDLGYCKQLNRVVRSECSFSSLWTVGCAESGSSRTFASFIFTICVNRLMKDNVFKLRERFWVRFYCFYWVCCGIGERNPINN